MDDLPLFLGDVCPHAEASQAGGVGEVAGEAGGRPGGLHEAHRPQQDHSRPANIVDNLIQNLLERLQSS